ncbi:SDR family oxidoreductase [candidate division KSB1 bacterium]|nr:SDR family oxidoreductase [candidate division KSB1 bacterium]
MRYLVTGGAGFIGSNIVEELIRRGDKVSVLDNFSTGRRENIQSFMDDVELIEGDIRSLSTVYRAVDEVDFIIHQAALPSVPRSIADPITTNEVNITGTLNVLIAARDRGVRRVVFASSSSVYGNDPRLPKHEDMRPRPMSPYAISKLAGEVYCSVFDELYDLETVILRYFNIFGPRQDPTSQYSAVIPKFINTMSKNRRVTIFGDGKQSRDFTFVENVVRTNLKACEIENLPKERVFNCACGDRISLDEMVIYLNKIMHKDLNPNFVEPRPGDVRHSFADVSKAVNFLNYSPSVKFEEGLKRTVEWFLANK